MRAPTLRRYAARALCLSLVAVAGVAAARAPAADSLEPARAALRSLRFDRAARLLSAAADAGDADADYLLGMIT